MLLPRPAIIVANKPVAGSGAQMQFSAGPWFILNGMDIGTFFGFDGEAGLRDGADVPPVFAVIQRFPNPTERIRFVPVATGATKRQQAVGLIGVVKYFFYDRG